jgi:tetratricopeptide (TPR) repeat protein
MPPSWAKTGHGQIVAAVAEAGVGKSRLFYEFKATNQFGWMVLEAFSVSHGKAATYLPIIDLLHGYFRIAKEDDQRTRREKVNGRIVTLDPALEDTRPYLFGLLGLVEGSDPLRQMDAQIRRRRTQDAIKRTLLRESLNQPLILVFEDLHQVDEETQALLNLLADSIGTSRVLLLVNYRPEYSHSWGSKTYYTQVRLDPLGRESADEMLSSLLGNDESVAPLKRLIAEKTEGNPLFMEEIYQALIEEGVLVRNGALRITRPLNALKLPPTVQAILAARIDRLPPEQKGLLETVAVIGKDFRLGLVGKVVARSQEELERTLTQLQLAEFIYEHPAAGDTEYTFKHQLTQEVAYNSLLVEQRRALHERVAEAIEELATNTLDDHLADLAHHYGRSANVRKAVLYQRLAGAQAAWRRFAFREAAAHLRSALEAIKSLPDSRQRSREELALLNALSDLVMFGEGFGAPELERIQTRALALSKRVGEDTDLFRSLLGAFHRSLWTQDLPRAREFGEEMLAVAQRTGRAELAATAHGELSRMFLFLGQLAGARTHADQALGLQKREAPESGDNLHFLADALFPLGYPDQAISTMRQAVDLGRRSGPFALAAHLEALAWVFNLVGRPQQGLEFAEEALALCSQHGFLSLAGFAEVNRGSALILVGRLEEGFAQTRCSVATLEESGNIWAERFVFHANACWKAHRPAEGLATVEEGLLSARATGRVLIEADLHRLRGDLLLIREPPDEDEAERCFEKAIDVSRKLDAKWCELGATMSLARLLARQDHRDEARAILAEIYNWFTEGFDTADLKEAKALLEELGT